MPKTEENMLRLVKDLSLTLVVGLSLGGGLMGLSALLDKSIPERPEQRPIFILGILLFSFAFRLLFHVRDEGKKS